MLFLGAAFIEPTEKAAKDGAVERVVVDLRLVVAKNMESAKTQLIAEATSVKNAGGGPLADGELDRLVVRVVPFA